MAMKKVLVCLFLSIAMASCLQHKSVESNAQLPDGDRKPWSGLLQKPIMLTSATGFYEADEAAIAGFVEAVLNSMFEADDLSNEFRSEQFQVAWGETGEAGERKAYLHLRSVSGHVEVGILLEETAEAFLLREGTKTCICTGSANACALVVFGGNCLCSSPPHHSPACVKTEIATVEF